MGVYWNISSFRKVQSIISGEIKCRNMFEININESWAHEVRRAGIRGGIESLNLLKKQGRFIQNEENETLFEGFISNIFYLESNDLFDGKNLRVDDTGNTFGIAWNPIVAYGYFKNLSNGDSTFSHISDIEQRNGLEEILMILEEAMEEDFMVSFYWIE
jgi:hypothetical protein